MGNLERDDSGRVCGSWKPQAMFSAAKLAVVPPERIELSSLAPEASTLSAELQGHAAT